MAGFILCGRVKKREDLVCCRPEQWEKHGSGVAEGETSSGMSERLRGWVDEVMCAGCWMRGMKDVWTMDGMMGQPRMGKPCTSRFAYRSGLSLLTFITDYL